MTTKLADVMQFVEVYNEECAHVLPACRVVNGPREKLIRQALQEATLEDWRKAFRALAASEFHTGTNERSWKGSIDFVLRPSQRAIWIERGYEHESFEEHERMKREEAQAQYLDVIEEIARSKRVMREEERLKPCNRCGARSIAWGDDEEHLCFRCGMQKRKAAPGARGAEGQGNQGRKISDDARHASSRASSPPSSQPSDTGEAPR
jgi:hypothetical protein